jgi:hypothetical protein
MIEGSGAYRWYNPRVRAEGLFENARIHGLASVTYADASFYQGLHANGVRQGTGKWESGRIILPDHAPLPSSSPAEQPPPANPKAYSTAETSIAQGPAAVEGGKNAGKGDRQGGQGVSRSADTDGSLKAEETQIDSAPLSMTVVRERERESIYIYVRIHTCDTYIYTNIHTTIHIYT